MNPLEIAKFEKLYTPEPNTGCWLWLGPLDKDGYGTFSAPSKYGPYRAHRFSYLAYKGEIEGNLIVRHTCNVAWCVNPFHLILGTTQDNVNDRVRQGRSKYVRGEQHGVSKLTEKQVLEIRKLAKEGIPMLQIAKKLGIPYGRTVHVVKRSTWKWLTEEEG